MEPMAAGASDGIVARSRDDRRTAFAMTVWSLLSLVATVLVARRAGGAFQGDVGNAAPCVGATLAVLLSLFANAVWCTVNAGASLRKQVIAAALTLLPPFAVGGALWTSHSPLVGGYLAGLELLSVLATVAIYDLSIAAGGRLDLPPTTMPLPSVDLGSHHPETTQTVQPVVATTGSDFHRTIDELVDEEDEGSDPEMLQWMTRRQLDDGAEAVEGSVRIEFRPGERSASAHVTFSPPLGNRPQAECQVLVDFEGRVRIGVAQTYGLRIEARRPEPALAAAFIDVAFSARVPTVQSAAA
jgi:hypothetical protein